jgi:hypothetical protein
MFYSDFINDKKISHNEDIDNSLAGIQYLVESKADIISYNVCKNIEFNTTTSRIDNDSNYIYDYNIYRDTDIIDDIHFISSNKNIKMKFIIGECEYDDINIFILTASSYTEFKLRFISTEKPDIDDKISIYYKDFFLNGKLRIELRKEPVILTNTNEYRNGMCNPI